jgi:hypothetical protein
VTSETNREKVQRVILCAENHGWLSTSFRICN